METKSGIKVGGEFRADYYRNGELIAVDETHNLVTTEGLTRIMNVMFNQVTQTTTWYCGLVETNTTATATMNYDVPIFTETTAYDGTTRPAYVEATSTTGSITNSANPAAFTISATKTIYGAGLFSIDTKGDTTGGANNVLYCYGLFSTGRAVVDDDIINLTYTLSAIDAG